MPDSRRNNGVESFIGKLVVEHVSGFVILVEESQRDGCFPFAKNIQILGTNAIFFHEVDDDVTDRVFPDFADECGRYT